MILDLQKRVGNCFETHKTALLDYASLHRPGDMGRRAPDDDVRTPGKLKNPFGPREEPERDSRIPGKL